MSDNELTGGVEPQEEGERVEAPLLLSDPGELRRRRVREVGGGRGVGLEILASLRPAELSGFDLDPAMVALARTSGRERPGDPRVRWRRHSDLRARLPLRCGGGVRHPHHIPPWREVLAEIARVLRLGGVFYFEDVLRGFTTAWPISRLFDHPLQTQFGAAELGEALEATGFQVQSWYQLGPWAILGRAARR